MSENKPDKLSIKEAWEAAKLKESAGRNTGTLPSSSSIDNHMSTQNNSLNANNSITTILICILIGLVCIVIVLLAWNTFKSKPKYAYKVLSVQAQFNQKPQSTGLTSNADVGGTSVNLKDEELTILGNEGWELVGTFLEVETTHPNYGNSQYVTGLQPNIRPQRAVMIFKKQLD